MTFNWQTEYHRYQRYFVNIGQFYQRKKTRVYTEVVLSFLTATFFLFFAIKPTLVTITSLVKEIKDQQLVNQKLGEKIQALTQAQQEYARAEANLYLVNQALPQTANLSIFAKELEVLARTANITLEAIQFESINLKGKLSETKNEALTPTVNFKLGALGNYLELKNFLHLVTSLRRLVSVTSFSFSQDKKEEKIMNLSLSAQAHFLETEE